MFQIIKIKKKSIKQWTGYINNKILKPLSSQLGHDIRVDVYGKSDKYDFEDETSDIVGLLIPNYTMLSAPRLITLYQQVRYLELNNIEGDLVECGVWRGGAAGMMSQAQLKFGEKRRQIHLFDSFEGLPKATIDDNVYEQRSLGVRDGELMESTGRMKADISYVKRLLFEIIKYPKDYVTFHIGWFQDTVNKAQNEKIALLRLDGDLYESTKICLEGFWDKVVSKGIIIIDDYGSFEGCKKAVDEFIHKLDYKPLLNHIEGDGGRYIIKM
ncbi:MAG: class I SAM-dependent methyltransferase [Nitrospirae bacterium]|nr:class I SAM-dependent methyltransferase [Nitrospirota bacterium]